MSDHDGERIEWRTVEPLAPGQVDGNGTLAAVDALRNEWEKHWKAFDEKERNEIRRRTLRRLAIETGILERLYDIEWGLTLTLVAEGFTRDVVERSGGRIDERTLATLRAQRDSLEMVLDFVQEDRRLSPSFVKELHAAITRTQETYTVTDSLGRVVETELPRGEWKRYPNSVQRQDGRLLEYAPPEQVASEMDNLCRLYDELERQPASKVHALIKASWLHHAFVRIHPFADGNGRVARALTLLVLQKHHYAPLVVDRYHRGAYLEALDAANEGRLSLLVRLFARLETAALAGELERGPEPAAKGLAVEVAHSLAEQIANLRRRKQDAVAREIGVRAKQVGGFLAHWFTQKEKELRAVFTERGVGDADIRAFVELPPDPTKAEWFRSPIIRSARRAGHHASFVGAVGWANLRVKLEGLKLLFLASLHGVGHDTGVMAVTTCCEIERSSGPDEAGVARWEDVELPNDAFLFVHQETTEQLDERRAELHQMLEQALVVALAGFQSRLR